MLPIGIAFGIAGVKGELKNSLKLLSFLLFSFTSLQVGHAFPSFFPDFPLI